LDGGSIYCGIALCCDRSGVRVFPQTEFNIERKRLAEATQSAAAQRVVHSNYWRLIGLFFFFVSLIAFVAGCVLGAKAVIVAKDRMEFPSTQSK
jgi:hypothetical protein